MNNLGGSEDILVATRGALLDALGALKDQSNGVIVVGAQAIHLHTGGAAVALAEATKDADLALNPASLEDDPLIEEALRAAGFELEGGQPGMWISPSGTPVDLLLPAGLAGISEKRRSVRIPPHANYVARNTRGIEGCVIDNQPMRISALDPTDARVYEARVAGPAGLLVAKAIKIGERIESPGRLNDKDAHDIYRLLVATDTHQTALSLRTLTEAEISSAVAEEAIHFLRDLFAAGPTSIGSTMAGRAEEGIGEPAQVANAVTFLVADLLEAFEG